MHPRFAHGVRSWARPLVIHANYLINLAASQPMLRTRSIQAFHDELVRGVALGADFLVVHPGARGENSSQHAVGTIIEGVKQAAKRVPLGNLRILIENRPAWAPLSVHLWKKLPTSSRSLLAECRRVPRHRHLFAAGYDVSSEKGLEQTIEHIEDTIGLANVPVFHVNDSKIPLGAASTVTNTSVKEKLAPPRSAES